MTEHHHHGAIPPRGEAGDTREAVEFDREIQFKQLVWLGVTLLATAALSGVLVFFLLRGFMRSQKEAEGPPPIVAPAPVMISGPVLLARPENELARVRGEEKAKIESYGWVDQASGVAHIPIDRAIELVAQQGLPARAAQPGAGVGAPATATVPPVPPTSEAPSEPAATESTAATDHPAAPAASPAATAPGASR